MSFDGLLVDQHAPEIAASAVILGDVRVGAGAVPLRGRARLRLRVGTGNHLSRWLAPAGSAAKPASEQWGYVTERATR